MGGCWTSAILQFCNRTDKKNPNLTKIEKYSLDDFIIFFFIIAFCQVCFKFSSISSSQKAFSLQIFGGSVRKSLSTASVLALYYNQELLYKLVNMK